MCLQVSDATGGWQRKCWFLAAYGLFSGNHTLPSGIVMCMAMHDRLATDFQFQATDFRPTSDFLMKELHRVLCLFFYRLSVK